MSFFSNNIVKIAFFIFFLLCICFVSLLWLPDEPNPRVRGATVFPL